MRSTPATALIAVRGTPPHRTMKTRLIPFDITLRPTLGAAIGATMLALASPLWAGPGHDHDHEDDHATAAAALATSTPRRQPDGSVFLPSVTQRQLGVHTVTATPGTWPRTLSLPGKVVMDPNAGGRVQAAIAGRLQSGPAGLPTLGQTVRQGQVLAHVQPTPGASELASQQAQQAALRASLALAERRLARLQALADTVARKDIEAAAAELDSLQGQLRSVTAGLTRRDPLVAPVSGVIASSHAVAG